MVGKTIKKGQDKLLFFDYGCCVPTWQFFWMIITLFIFLTITCFCCCIITCIMKWLYKHRVSKRVDEVRMRYREEAEMKRRIDDKIRISTEKYKGECAHPNSKPPPTFSDPLYAEGQMSRQNVPVHGGSASCIPSPHRPDKHHFGSAVRLKSVDKEATLSTMHSDTPYIIGSGTTLVSPNFPPPSRTRQSDQSTLTAATTVSLPDTVIDLVKRSAPSTPVSVNTPPIESPVQPKSRDREMHFVDPRPLAHAVNTMATYGYPREKPIPYENVQLESSDVTSIVTPTTTPPPDSHKKKEKKGSRSKEYEMEIEMSVEELDKPIKENTVTPDRDTPNDTTSTVTVSMDGYSPKKKGEQGESARSERKQTARDGKGEKSSSKPPAVLEIQSEDDVKKVSKRSANAPNTVGPSTDFDPTSQSHLPSSSNQYQSSPNDNTSQSTVPHSGVPLDEDFYAQDTPYWTNTVPVRGSGVRYMEEGRVSSSQLHTPTVYNRQQRRSENSPPQRHYLPPTPTETERTTTVPSDTFATTDSPLDVYAMREREKRRESRRREEREQYRKPQPQQYEKGQQTDDKRIRTNIHDSRSGDASPYAEQSDRRPHPHRSIYP